MAAPYVDHVCKDDLYLYTPQSSPNNARRAAKMIGKEGALRPRARYHPVDPSPAPRADGLNTLCYEIKYIGTSHGLERTAHQRSDG